MRTEQQHERHDDPADSLMRRGLVVLVVGGFVLFQLPRAIAAIVKGTPSERLGACLWFLFFAWLTWRLVVMFRHSRGEVDPGYWTVSTVGFAAFAFCFAAYYGWLFVTQDQESGDVIRVAVSVLLVLGLALVSAYAARRARSHPAD